MPATKKAPDFNEFLFARKYDWIGKGGEVEEITYKEFAKRVEEDERRARSRHVTKGDFETYGIASSLTGGVAWGGSKSENEAAVREGINEAKELRQKLENFVHQTRQEYNRLYVPTTPQVITKQKRAKSPVPAG